MKLLTQDETLELWADYDGSHGESIHRVYNLGVEHGRQQAVEERPLWPTPIADRPPKEADGDEHGYVMAVDSTGYWHARPWHSAAELAMPWQHMPGWQPKPPTLKEQALAVLFGRDAAQLNAEETLLIRRALEAQP